MKYYKQEKNYTCGVACLRMVFSAQGLLDIDEDTLEEMVGCLPESGTHYDSMVSIAEKVGLDCIHKEGGTIKEIDELTKQGWSVVVAYSVDVPHFAVYESCNDNHLFLCDPFFGEHQAHLKSKFERAIWGIDVSKYRYAIAEMDLKLDKSLDTKCWYVAYKQKTI